MSTFKIYNSIRDDIDKLQSKSIVITASFSGPWVGAYDNDITFIKEGKIVTVFIPLIIKSFNSEDDLVTDDIIPIGYEPIATSSSFAVKIVTSVGIETGILVVDNNNFVIF